MGKTQWSGRFSGAPQQGSTSKKWFRAWGSRLSAQGGLSKPCSEFFRAKNLPPCSKLLYLGLPTLNSKNPKPVKRSGTPLTGALNSRP